MSIFSRRKRTRHLFSLAISAVATSLCSSQVALCLPFEVKVEKFFFDNEKNCFYILCQNVRNSKSKIDSKMTIGEYNCCLTSDRCKFLSMVGNNWDCCTETIDFSSYTEAKTKLDYLKQEFEKEQKRKQEIEQAMGQVKEQEEQAIEQAIEQKRKQEIEQWRDDVSKICYLIEEYAKDKSYIEINAKGDSGWKEDLRKIISYDPLIQHGLKYPKRYHIVEKINGKLERINITEQNGKFVITIKLV